MFNFICGSGSILILASIFRTNIAGGYNFHDEDKNRTCIPAEDEPDTINSKLCYPLVNFTRPFCENNGIVLPKYLFLSPEKQNFENDLANEDRDKILRLGISKISLYSHYDIETVNMCDRVYKLFRCHFFFPGCDWTQSVFRRRKICRKTCLVAKRKCYNIWTFVRDLVDTPQTSQKTKELFNCEKEEPYISRNAGDTPECWYYDFRNPTDESSSAREWKINADCLYLNGSSYHGNISVTDSGTPCQSWTEQCPHRHTMNTTYPELNNAKNYCRNPKNSGKRPWCFTTDRNKRWEYCDIPKCIPVDGGYSNWTIKSACSVTCGEGLQTWTRVCKNPEPKFGGRDCSHFGERDEYRPCFVKPCIVNGGFSTWSLSIPCNVSCGGGVEIWKRSCDNPEPKYGGRNCSRLGNSMELRSCNTMPCPIDGNYSNWTRASPCSVTCGEGVEVWIRECDNPPGEYGGNCSKQGPDQERRSCRNEACPVSSEEIGVIAIVASFLLVAAITIFIFLRKRRRKREYIQHYAICRFSSQHFPGREQEQSNNNNTEECASSSQRNGTIPNYGNLTSEGKPAPCLSRGIVPYKSDYINTRPSQRSWYDRLQVFRPITVEWLRNAWGNVDVFGNNVYDVMQRYVGRVFVLYDKAGNTGEGQSAGSCNPPRNTLEKSSQGDSNGSEKEERSQTYDTLKRLPSVVLPTGSGNALTTRIA